MNIKYTNPKEYLINAMGYIVEGDSVYKIKSNNEKKYICKVSNFTFFDDMLIKIIKRRMTDEEIREVEGGKYNARQ